MNYIIKGVQIRKGDRILFAGSEKFATVLELRNDGEYPAVKVKLDDGRIYWVGLEPITFIRRGKAK
jgi:hypothetical protein